MDALHKQETRLDHDLRDGKAIHASISLQDEFQSNPQAALALVQRELRRENCPSNHDQLHLTVDAKSGDIFVMNNNREGYYAGTLTPEMRAQLAPPDVVQQSAQGDSAAVVGSLPAHPEVPMNGAAPAPAPEQQAAYPPPPGAQPSEYQQPRQPGFHIPFPIQIGVHNGSLQLGVNILGLADGGVTLGAQNRGYVGSDVAETQFSAGVDLNQRHIGPAADWHVFNGALTEGSAQVGINPHRDSVSLGAGVQANALDGTVGTGGHAAFALGRRTGPEAGAYGYVGPADVNANGAANLSDQGLQAGVDGNVGIEPVVGFHAQGRAGLGTRTEANAAVGTNIGDNGASVGAGLYPQLQPDVYTDVYSGPQSAGLGLNPPRAWNTMHGRNAQPLPPIESGGLY